MAILNNPKYGEKIQYLIGSVFRDRVLRRGKVHKTKVFIMANQFIGNYHKDDTFAILATKSIYLFDKTNKIYAQIVGSDHLFNTWADWDVVISTQAFKMGD